MYLEKYCFLSDIDSILPSYITVVKNNSKQYHRSTSELNKRSNEKSSEQSTKRLRFDEKDKSTLNVFDIFNQSEHEISTTTNNE